MAFGFGFNKQKVLSAAEKFVQQGKLQNAIAEYEKVLKADPKDLTVMNTVGDLYSRLGNIDKAVDCFKSVGDAYATQGFTVKAIAMYKKLSKIKHTFEGVLRLAELYTQQGLFNDARAQYLQVAEEFLRSGELDQAVRIFQKTLEMDPDNVVMRSKLAEVYVRLGKKAEAWQIFAAAAETLRSRGQLDGAETILQRMLTLDPGNSYALLMRGRTAADSGDTSGAIQYLEKVADLDNHPEGMRALLNAYIQGGRLADARVLAGKLLSVHNDPAAVTTYADALTASGQFEEALQTYNEYSDSLLASDPAKVLDSLHSIISHVRDSAPSLETILALFAKAGENSHIAEVYELLAHAYVQSGDLEKARDYYQKLTQLEPQNQLHARNYQQIVGKLGGAEPRLISSEEGSILIEELETSAPFIDQRYDDDVALAVRAALTDAELFVSYNMPEKAVGPLLSVLPKAPRDLRLNQRLAALHNRAERFTEAAICCRTLESIYHDAGYPEEATRYGELAARYEERATASSAAATDAHAAQLETAIGWHGSVPPATAPSGLFFHSPTVEPTAPATHAPEFEVGAAKPAAGSEIDLSSEWDGALSEQDVPVPTPPDFLHEDVPHAALVHDDSTEEVPALQLVEEPAIAEAQVEIPASNAGAIAETIEEIRFYLANSMVDLAHTAFEKLQGLNPETDTVSLIRGEIETASLAAAHDQTASEISVEEVDAPVEAEAHSVPAHEPEIPVEATLGALDGLAADLNSSLGVEFLAPSQVATEEPGEPSLVPQHEAVAYSPEAAAIEPSEVETPAEPQIEHTTYVEPKAWHETDALGSIVNELEASLGDSFLVQPEAAAIQPETIDAPPAKLPSDHPIAATPLPPAAMAAAAPGSSTAPPASWNNSTGFTTFTTPPIAGRPPRVEDTPIPTLSADSLTGFDLAGMFGDLKQELEADAANTDEDPETHYNLGVAFREMGLLDEAIGELQKVCQTVEHGHPFAQILQTYTWLAQCFLDKGIPEAAIRWYERALALATLNGETRTALHYELACAYETAGNKGSALHHFMEVYGGNIDYRDVSERIKALKS